METRREGLINFEAIADDYDYDTGEMGELEWEYNHDHVTSDDEDLSGSHESSESSYSPSSGSVMNIDS